MKLTPWWCHTWTSWTSGYFLLPKSYFLHSFSVSVNIATPRHFFTTQRLCTLGSHMLHQMYWCFALLLSTMLTLVWVSVSLAWPPAAPNWPPSWHFASLCALSRLVRNGFRETRAFPGMCPHWVSSLLYLGGNPPRFLTVVCKGPHVISLSGLIWCGNALHSLWPLLCCPLSPFTSP